MFQSVKKDSYNIINLKNNFSIELFMHFNNVANIVMKMADEMKFSVEEKQYLYEEALYHDIGKSKIPETILYKNDRLSSEEWELMKLHANYSQALYLSMVNNNDVSKEKAKVIRHHHENWDGSGYIDPIV